ncbi:plexin-C1 isoform X2 [Sceloporus undulatus]|uniref:plexin-C1 isoform X2 n=1 Tax=Sceloporus undulatus TaxID=8520 RepID=UPI001C4AD829|nr:plexin-C1 isoform X2 [Sceloporus undulatus]
MLLPPKQQPEEPKTLAAALCMARALALAAWLLWAASGGSAAAAAAAPTVLSFPAPVSALAVAGGRVLVASGPCWYEAPPSLAWKSEGRCQTQAQGEKEEEEEAHNQLLLPFGGEAEGDGDGKGWRLLSCWTKPDCGCILQELLPEAPGGSPAASPSIRFGRELVSSFSDSRSAGCLYFSPGLSEWLLVLATSHQSLLRPGSRSRCSEKDKAEEVSESTARTAVSLSGRQREGRVGEEQALFLASSAGEGGEQQGPLAFAEAFLAQGHFFFPFWHPNRRLAPKMLVLQRDLAQDQLRPRGQKALRCLGHAALRASHFLRARLLWIGLFGEEPRGHQGRPEASALCLFPLQGLLRRLGGCSFGPGAEFEPPSWMDTASPCEEIAWPLNNSTLLTHSGLVSVYATVVLNKTVLFLGTQNGQLLKVILDDNMKSNCPEILYEIEDESPVFHKLELDPVNEEYIYLPSNNEIRRIQVANCSKYVSCKECLSALDPHCGWCHLKSSCTLKGECPFLEKSLNWTSILYGTDKCLKIYTSNPDRGEISVTASGDSLALSEGFSTCTMINAKTSKVLCKHPGINCTCQLKTADLIDKVRVSVVSGSWQLTEMLEFNACPSQKTCSECKRLGCSWDARENRCVVSTDTCKRKVNCDEIISTPSRNVTLQRSKPMIITSIKPAWISTLGKSEVLVIGENFTGSNILMEISGTSSCKPDEISVTKVLNHTHMKFCLPPSRKEVKSVCIKESGFQCSHPVPLHYVSLPKCSEIFPNITWRSGGRNIIIHGRYLNITDSVLIVDEMEQTLIHFTCHTNSVECNFTTPAIKPEKMMKMAAIVLTIEERHVPCIKLQYDPDPEFIHYELTTDLEPDLELKIHKKNDSLNISRSEIEIFLSHVVNKELVNITFTVQNISNTEDRSIIHSRAKNSGIKIDRSSVKVYVKVGNFVHEVPNETHGYVYLYILFLIIPIVIVAAVLVTQRKSKQLNRKLSAHLELLECEIRKEIREGFVELQMEKLDVVNNFGTIPFLDYKHFVLRTFFPEPGGNPFIFIEDSSALLSRSPSQKDESITELSKLICNKKFLVTLIHTLEKQKTFSVRDRCLFASFLTIALQTNLVYLTDILEVLTRDLMDQSSNAQPKLMLRRTESVVEKLLTNWMSVCLSGFLRETVGEPFYLLVTTLNQRMIKGPVDVITCKALYTLNEDWLLWQVTEFNTVALNVVFENIQENEGEGTTQNIQVNALDCDTIGQAKEKILQAFLNKNGALYGLQLSEMGLALQSGVYMKELLDVDSSSVILEDGIIKLNTIGHYEISDGATIKVFKKEETIISGCSDEEYSDNYCHLILPDSEAAKDTQSAKHKGKQKFKVKEMYLTKLLSTKVAVHSVVEKLFRSIWTLPNNKAPIAIKYFFDFLDTQAENKKITDPDVVHIWKTNSLPLRFWVNILKNPQFVFDIKKTPHIDGCLSVIAQAFMDAFSVSEQQLGKEAPTNKLLYAKDIPLYKEEVKAFYKAIKELPPLSTSEIEDFLTQESKILNKLEKERGLEEAQQQLLNIKSLVEEKKNCKWIKECTDS